MPLHRFTFGPEGVTETPTPKYCEYCGDKFGPSGMDLIGNQVNEGLACTLDKCRYPRWGELYCPDCGDRLADDAIYCTCDDPD
jgi:hypothetical protein